MDNFDFVVSSGLQPRLWIDAVSHVAMGRDRRTYRFLKDTRIGRVVLAESTEMKPVVDQVTRYVAERVVERQRMMEGGVEPAVAGMKRAGVLEAEPPLRVATRSKGWSALLSGLALIAAGALVGLALAAIEAPASTPSSSVCKSDGGVAGPVSPRRVRRMRQLPFSPSISNRLYCAAGCLPPGAWPAA
eukprot:gene68351-93658_t